MARVTDDLPGGRAPARGNRGRCQYSLVRVAEESMREEEVNNNSGGLTRREFLSSAAAATVAVSPLNGLGGNAPRALAQGAPVVPPEVATAGRPQGTEKFGPSVDNIPIIDAHIHLFDGTRPQGASYMGSAAYRGESKTSLPRLYAPLARPAGIVGAIVVESSAWVEDNLWYLEVSQADPIMVGVS